MAKKSIRTQIADELRRRDLTGKQAAELLGVGQPTVSRWITGPGLPGPESFPALARFLRRTEQQVAADVYETGRDERIVTLSPADIELMNALLDQGAATDAHDAAELESLRSRLMDERPRRGARRSQPG